MENPRRLLGITVGITATCAGVAYGLHLADKPGTDDWQGAVLVFFACFAAYGVIALPFVWRSIRKFDRIRRGERALARWTVPVDEWAAFLAHERAGWGNPAVLSNLVDVEMRVPRGGVEIVIAPDAVVVGSELHRLQAMTVQACRGPWFSANPLKLEYQITQIDATDQYVDRAIRFPVAAGAEGQAKKCAVN